MIRVLVVDDHAIVRQGLSRLLGTAPGIELVAEAANGNEALHLVRRHRPDVVLMDITMPVLDGIGATRLITQHDPLTMVLLLTSAADEQVVEGLAAGACGVLYKHAEIDELLEAVRAAARGDLPVTAPVAVVGPDGPGGSLSTRETEVLELLAEGRTNRQIAAALGITERTVKAHLSRVFRVLDVTDRVQAALWGRDNLAPTGS